MQRLPILLAAPAPAWTALCIALCAGCGGDDRPGEPAPGAPGPAGSGAPRDDDEVAGAGELDDLMALPYAGFVDEDGDVEGLVTFDRARADLGYTLVSVYSAGMALLVHPAGEVVHHWRAPWPSRWAHVELMEDGEILTTGILVEEGETDADVEQAADDDASGRRRYALRMTWNGDVVWQVFNQAHHELTRDPEGRLVALTAADLDVELPGIGARTIRDNLVATLDESGETVRSVSLYGMIAARPEAFPLRTTAPGDRKKKRFTDLIHANAIEWMGRPDLAARSPLYGPHCVVLSMRHQDRIAIFDLERGELLWAWGQDVLSGPHDVQLLESGRLILLDNGVAEQRSRVLEVDPLTGRITWEWQAPTPGEFFTRTKGSVERLSNGNTLVCNADSGEVFEITPDGDVVWRYLTPVRGADGKRCTLHRARRFGADFIDGLIAEHGADPAY